jgi:hypothetical protein
VRPHRWRSVISWKDKGFFGWNLPLETSAAILARMSSYSRLMHGDEEATMATLSAHRALSTS